MPIFRIMALLALKAWRSAAMWLTEAIPRD
jgi:hypothetical protein